MSAVTDKAAGAFLYDLRRVTEAAAIAAYDWIGRGNKEEGDAAAVTAMRRQLSQSDIDGIVVIGEGAKDNAPELPKGERIGGNPHLPPRCDIAVDPVEGTSFLAKGQTNAMAVIAAAPRGSMLDCGPCFYMEKLAVPPAAKGKVDPAAPVEARLEMLAHALNKRVDELTVYILEKPRHRELIERIVAAGARAMVYPAGDVAGALMAAIPNSGIDALMGTGGTPEGIISACAIRGLGAEFLGRLDPQLQTEQAAVKAAGLDTKRWYQVDELVTAEEVYFCATGITTGLLFQGVARSRTYDCTETLMINGVTRERQILRTWSPRVRAA